MEKVPFIKESVKMVFLGDDKFLYICYYIYVNRTRRSSGGKEKIPMKKMVFTNLHPYKYDAAHSRAHYTIDGEHYMTAGDLSEAQLSYKLGFGFKKDANTAFDAGSDIEPLHMSVKSGKAALTSIMLGITMQESLDCYFERTASTCWAWVVLIEDTLTAYVMETEAEFREFTETWAKMETNSRSGHTVVRYKATSGKMITWFEERI